ncbi:hypothetical protein NADFUDRAFT_82819, partial [Nadsonia fulvescens var. elongata DSM 6958]
MHALDIAGTEATEKAEKSLVILLGAKDAENERIREGLRELSVIDGFYNEDIIDSENSTTRGKSRARRGLTILNKEQLTVDKRSKLYEQGGIFSITSRILIVDMLSNVLNPAKITGIVILHAEKVKATSTEAFIVRFYRQANKYGFLKALSDEPEAFASGFSPLATMMKNLFLKKSFLWPRFHIEVRDSLVKKRSDVDSVTVVEIDVPMTESMRAIQTATMECIEACISELKRANPFLDTEYWNMDNALNVNFSRIIRGQLDPIWHKISWKTKQIVADLATLRQVLRDLLTYDSVSFYQTLEAILAANSPIPGSLRQNQSPWLFMDAADTIFTTGKERVFKDLRGKQGKGYSRENIVPVLEELPKWEQIARILDEITIERSHSSNFHGPILLMCRERKTARQIKEFLRSMKEEKGRMANEDSSTYSECSGYSAEKMMKRKLNDYLSWKDGFLMVSKVIMSEQVNAYKETQNNPLMVGKSNNSENGTFTLPSTTRAPPQKRRRVRGGLANAGGDRPISKTTEYVTIDDNTETLDALKDRESPGSSDDDLRDPGDESDDLIEIKDTTEELESELLDQFELLEMDDLIIVQNYNNETDDMVLEELQPSAIIMYEPDPSFIRRVEVYRASSPSKFVKVYFMYYGLSVEEQGYLGAVRKEKDSFTKLIREKANLTVTLTTDADNNPESQLLSKVNSRIAGGSRLMINRKKRNVIVDIREFRSSLPSLLHGNNLNILPCMLTVGDYIISQNICVERKSLPDLISSFKDGRLFAQCEAMFRYYTTPMLLIEFDENKSFSFEPLSDLPGQTGNTNAAKLVQSDIHSKLILLIIAFPQLRIIWSSSPYQTAEIFDLLKVNEDEPDVELAVSYGMDSSLDASNVENYTAISMLRNIPGITLVNYRTIINNVENLQELCQMSESDLAVLIGKEAARKVYKFINRNLR